MDFTTVVTKDPAAVDATVSADKPRAGSPIAAALQNMRERIADGSLKITADGEPPPTPTPPPEPKADEPETTGAAPETKDAAPVASGPVQGADGRWRNPDGSFARDPNAPAPEETAAPAEGQKPDEQAADVVQLILRGETDRGEEDIQVDVEPAIAERIKRLENGSMRRAEVARRMDAIEAKEADFRILEASMRAAPDAFILRTLQPQNQVRVAEALVAKHWDVLLPKLVDWSENPHKRELAIKDNEIAESKWQQQAQATEQVQRAHVRILRQIEDAIPDNTNETKADRFRMIVESELTQWMQAHPNRLPEQNDVKAVLESVAADLGLGAQHPQNGATPATANGTKPTAASTPAKASAPSPGVQKRAAQAAQSRAIARRVSPAGAGGVPTEPPAVPRSPNGKTALKDTFAYLRAHPGLLSSGAGGAG